MELKAKKGTLNLWGNSESLSNFSTQLQEFHNPQEVSRRFFSDEIEQVLEERLTGSEFGEFSNEKANKMKPKIHKTKSLYINRGSLVN